MQKLKKLISEVSGLTRTTDYDAKITGIEKKHVLLLIIKHL